MCTVLDLLRQSTEIIIQRVFSLLITLKNNSKCRETNNNDDFLRNVGNNY